MSDTNNSEGMFGSGMSPEEWMNTRTPEELLEAASRARARKAFLVEDMFLRVAWQKMVRKCRKGKR